MAGGPAASAVMASTDTLTSAALPAHFQWGMILLLMFASDHYLPTNMLSVNSQVIAKMI
jgi:hypothetical protein